MAGRTAEAAEAGRTVVALAERIAAAAGAGCIAVEQAERIAAAAEADKRLLPEERRRPSADGS